MARGAGRRAPGDASGRTAPSAGPGESVHSSTSTMSRFKTDPTLEYLNEDGNADDAR